MREYVRDEIGQFAFVASGDKAAKRIADLRAAIRRHNTIRITKRGELADGPEPTSGPPTLVAPKGHNIRQADRDLLRRTPVGARDDQLSVRNRELAKSGPGKAVYTLLGPHDVLRAQQPGHDLLDRRNRRRR